MDCCDESHFRATNDVFLRRMAPVTNATGSRFRQNAGTERQIPDGHLCPPGTARHPQADTVASQCPKLPGPHRWKIKRTHEQTPIALASLGHHLQDMISDSNDAVGRASLQEAFMAVKALLAQLMQQRMSGGGV
jgi:hypothetical protein